MKRVFTCSTKLEDCTFDSFPSAGMNSDYIYPNDGSPYHLHHNNMSDSESISDDSRKIRKKRNTYQKIPDDTRVKLLEAVQNGETLKSAAKRYKINYSSAKSILHTYRKEGRILKKSAQERTTKKRIISPDCDTPVKPSKSCKKEVTSATQSGAKAAESNLTVTGRTPSMNTCASLNDENSPATSGVNENFASILKMEHYERHTEDKKPLAEAPLFQFNTKNLAKHEEPMMNTSSNMNHEHTYEAPQMGGTEGALGEVPTYTNYGQTSNEFDSFNDFMNNFQSRSYQPDDFLPESNAFGYGKPFNPLQVKMEDGTGFDDNGENNNSPLKSFIDTQNLLREAFRKASMISYDGNSSFRKSSIDMF